MIFFINKNPVKSIIIAPHKMDYLVTENCFKFCNATVVPAQTAGFLDVTLCFASFAYAPNASEKTKSTK